MQLGDLARIREIARPGFDLPDLAGNNFLVKRVIEAASDHPITGSPDHPIIAAAAARIMVEAFIWVDPHWESPRWRHEAFKLLHEQMRLELKEKGVEEAHAWLPPRIERPFGRRLMQLGWQRPAWADMFLEI